MWVYSDLIGDFSVCGRGKSRVWGEKVESASTECSFEICYITGSRETRQKLERGACKVKGEWEVTCVGQVK